VATSTLPTRSTQDGRVLRGARNRHAVVEAMLALIEEGDPRPTAKRVAERAGVALRSVFHYFDDVESVLAAAARLQAQRHWHLVQPVAPELPVGERVAQVVAQRSTLFERIAPARRAALLVEHDSPVIRAWLEEGRGRCAASWPRRSRPRSPARVTTCSRRSRCPRRGPRGRRSAGVKVFLSARPAGC